MSIKHRDRKHGNPSCRLNIAIPISGSFTHACFYLIICWLELKRLPSLFVCASLLFLKFDQTHWSKSNQLDAQKLHCQFLFLVCVDVCTISLFVIALHIPRHPCQVRHAILELEVFWEEATLVSGLHCTSAETGVHSGPWSHIQELEFYVGNGVPPESGTQHLAGNPTKEATY